MPSYQTHTKINYFLFLIYIIVMIYYIPIDFRFIMFNFMLFFGFVLGTELISPDVDTDSIPYKKFGFLWYPYKKLTGHRGKGSHSLMGIGIRLIYVLLILIGILILVGKLDEFIILLRSTNIVYIGILLIGIVVANIIHIFLDWISGIIR